jgi:hypothetical protein
MSSNLPKDYTPERAFEAYGRNEYTRWAIQSRLFDWPTPPFTISVVVVRTDKKHGKRRRLDQPIFVIFLYGYKDEPWHYLGGLWIAQGHPCWWRHVLLRVKKFYLESQFYDAR